MHISPHKLRWDSRVLHSLTARLGREGGRGGGGGGGAYSEEESAPPLLFYHSAPWSLASPFLCYGGHVKHVKYLLVLKTAFAFCPACEWLRKRSYL